MPGLGSFAEGNIATQLDLQQIQMNQFKLQEAPLKLQEDQIAIAKDKISLAQQVRMYSLMQNLKPPQQVDGADDMSGILGQMALIQLESGMPDAAAKTARAASALQENASKIEYRSYRMRNERMGKFASVLGSVPDSPQGLAQALQTMAAEDPGVAKDPTFQRLAQTPWRPGLVPSLKQSVLSQKDKAEIDYRNAAAQHAQAAAEVDRHRVRLVDAQEKLAETRAKDVAKEGGLKVKASQLKAITDMAEAEFGPSADQADIRVRSRPLAEEMVKMMKEQGLTESEAARRVYEKARSSGVFSGIRTVPVIKGSKPGVPLAPPKTAKEVKQNQWYLIDGVPRVAMGTKFYTEEELAAFDKEDSEVDEDSEDAN